MRRETRSSRALAGTQRALWDRTEDPTMIGTVLLVILVLLLIGAIPAWPYSSGWGYGPSGALGVVLIVVIVLVLMGRF
jgi:uncharacterized protein DUF3309